MGACHEVLVVEPHAGMRLALAGLLEGADGLSVATRAALSEVPAAVQGRPPAVVVVHRRLGDADDRHAVAFVRAVAPDAAILLSGMQDEPAYRRAAFDAGASGYVALDDPPGAILAAVRRAAPREGAAVSMPTAR